MKKLLTILVICLLSLGLIAVSSAKTVHAEDTLKNVNIDSDGVITWDAYAGTEEYDVVLNGDVVHTIYVNEYSMLQFDLKNYLLYNCMAEETYDVTIIAWKHASDYSTSWDLLASGSVKGYDHKAPKGQMAAPAKAWWNGTVANWNAVPEAEKYFIKLYRMGGLIADLILAEDTSTDLSYYMAGEDSGFEFRVSAGAWGYAKSEFTDSDLVYGIASTYERISGKNRYGTSIAVGEKVIEYAGMAHAAVIATGANFPDALSGAYLANRSNSPLLLISKGSAKDVCDFIRKNVSTYGYIYILGGENAVPEEWISSLKSDYENIIRLSGKTRYDTNLEILRAAGVGDRMNLLVCTGKDFADSLSVSSVDYPILLVGDKLNEKQKEFLSNEAKYCHFYIIGGSKAVSEEVREELMNYGAFEDRISGKNRYETSSEVAKYFYSDAHEIVLATGQDFPDGLSGGPLGNVRFAPILLVNPSGKNNFARVFADLKGISHAYILGGEAAVSTLHAEDILGLLPEMEPGTYIKVVISEQTLYYVENGKLIMTSPIVSGYGDTLLDDGTFYVQHMKEKATLKGSDYEEHVDYWIGFGRSGHYSNGGHILGIHDAQWRSEFGGEIYKTDPSHGCINLPLEKEAQLYSLVSVGTEVRIVY